jgi:hypothetical protein
MTSSVPDYRQLLAELIPWRILLVTVFASALSNLDQSLFGYAVPSVMGDLKVDIAGIGLMISISFALSVIVVPLIAAPGKRRSFCPGAAVKARWIACGDWCGMQRGACSCAGQKARLCPGATVKARWIACGDWCVHDHPLLNQAARPAAAGSGILSSRAGHERHDSAQANPSGC